MKHVESHVHPAIAMRYLELRAQKRRRHDLLKRIVIALLTDGRVHGWWL